MTALVLLHGMTSSGRAWDDLLPELSRHHRVHTPTALGHRGREPVTNRVTLTDVVDDAERYLDAHGLHRPHVAGHSLGGYIALELARRGRAETVTAISPAGFWSPSDGTAGQVTHGLRRGARVARATRPLAKLVVSTARGRRTWMGAAVHRPERMPAAAARDVIDDNAACTLADWLFLGDDAVVAPMDPLPCPITVAWAQFDDVLPLAQYESAVRTRLPGARFVVIAGAGHAAMVDERESVERIILETISDSGLP